MYKLSHLHQYYDLLANLEIRNKLIEFQHTSKHLQGPFYTQIGHHIIEIKWIGDSEYRIVYDTSELSKEEYSIFVSYRNRKNAALKEFCDEVEAYLFKELDLDPEFAQFIIDETIYSNQLTTFRKDY